MKWLIPILFLSSMVLADQCQITSPLPVPVSIAGCTFSSSLPSNSTSYIQNSLSPSTTSQLFSVANATVTTSLTVPYLTSGQCLTTNSAGLIGTTSCGSGGGGGSSTLATAYNGTQVTSPTVGINVISPLVAQAASSTMTLSVDLSTTANAAAVAISTATFLTSSLAATTYLTDSSATVTYVQISSANANFLTQSSATTTYFKNTSIIPVLNGGTGTSSPGLVAGTNITSITGSWPNQTINAATQSGGGGGASLLATAYNGVQVTSPTVGINVISPLVAQAASSTMTLSVDLSTTASLTQANAIAVSTGIISVSTISLQTQINGLGTTYLTNSSATATYVQISSANTNFLTQSSATATYLQLSSATATYLKANQAITLSGAITGTGATSITTAYNGTVPTSVLPSTVAFLTSTETFTGGQTFTSSETFNGAVVISTSISANGSVGTSGNVLSSQGPGLPAQWSAAGTGNAVLSSTQVWTGGNTYQSSSTFTNVTTLRNGTNMGITTVAANYTATSTDTFLSVSGAISGSIAPIISLPAATGSGHILTISKVDTSTEPVTIQAHGSDVISGTGTLILNAYTQTDAIIDAGTGLWAPWGQGLQISPPFISNGAAAGMNSIATTMNANNDIMLFPMQLSVPVNIQKVRYWVGATNTGTVDFGIYDQTGKLLTNNGGIANPTASTVATSTLTVVNLSPGWYYMAQAASVSTLTLLGNNSAAVFGGLLKIAGAASTGTLPATITLANIVASTASHNGFYMALLVSGGTSL